ncbi:MAG: head completion/stabilization protein [Rubrivivax sp.]|nr:MAG: head completion/stabilization protein [Rubrivivax sp.]
MSFLANAPTPTVTESPAEAIVTNGTWFPPVDPKAVREASRLDGTVTSQRLRQSIINAIHSVNLELAVYRATKLLDGYETLAAVPADQVDGASIKVHCYLRAVYACVQADLVERYRDHDTTGAGDKDADQLIQRADELRRDMRWAISDLLGIGRSTVELI